MPLARQQSHTISVMTFPLVSAKRQQSERQQSEHRENERCRLLQNSIQKEDW